jgi:hypothetical protein
MASRILVTFVAGLLLAAAPALAQTKILSATAQRVEGGPAFKVVTGIPKVLTRDGVTTVGDGALAENTIYVFPEAEGVVLTSRVRPSSGSAIPAGTKVDSFYICVDTVEAPKSPGPRNGLLYAGTVKFDNTDLLAVVLRPPQLSATADLLGKPGIVYANSRYTGVDPFWMGQDDHNFGGGTFRFFGDANGIDCRRLVFRAKG